MSEPNAAPAVKSKKKLIVIVAVLAVLILGAGTAWMVLANRHAEGDDGAPEHAAQAQPSKTPPTFLPIENMVVNLADPGGDRFAQVGITLELADAKAADAVKAYMPSIRSGVLLLLSQRTTDELLTREGKEKLAADIRREVSRPLGYAVPKPRKRPASRSPEDEDEAGEEPAPRPRVDNNPVRQVLFSSFIIQ